MGDYDWDISAVIRSYDINRPNNVVAPNIGLETFENDDWNSLDRLLAADMTNFNGFSEILSIDFPIAHQEKADDQLIMNQNDNQQLYLHPIQPTQFSQQISFPPLPTTIVCVPPKTTTPQQWTDPQEKHDIGANVNTNFTFSMRTPSIQTSIRKNKSIRITYVLLQEELIDDIWTWRKYGQKYTKGSPFPRNYYKCSTSKFCKAKKKIEKSPKNENLFLVSYSGEHNHHPPTNRRNLAGRNYSSKLMLPKGISVVPRALILNASSSSSICAKRSRAGASPSNPITPTLEIKRKNKMVFAATKNKGDGEEKENMNEDVLMGFEKLKGVTAST